MDPLSIDCRPAANRVCVIFYVTDENEAKDAEERRREAKQQQERGTGHGAWGRLKWPLSVVYFRATLCTFPDNSLGTLPAGLAPT